MIRYLRMIAVITPYAQFRFTYRAEDERNSVHFVFVRRTDKMPAPPTVCLFGSAQACTWSSRSKGA